MATTSTSELHNPWVRPTRLGGVIWSIWALAVHPSWTAVLLLLSPFVLLPLGLLAGSDRDTGPKALASSRLANLAAPLATIAAFSFLPQPGLLAALLSLPWLGYTIAVAAMGAGRLLSRRSLLDPGIGTDAGFMFLVVGGAWLTISRAGMNPLGFSDAIVQLTAVHFHYAGFALPIVAGVAASRLKRSALVPIAVIVGIPFTAAGITAGGWLEWVAATAMALAGMATAVLLLLLAARQTGRARVLMTAAGVALLGGMTLALGWAWSLRFAWDFLGLESMAATHGSLNALGFGLLGLIGLNLLPRGDYAKANGEFDASMHVGRPSAAVMQSLVSRAVGQETTNLPGLLDREMPSGFQRKVWKRRVEHGDFEVAANAIRQWSGHRAAGITRFPDNPSIAVGETLAVAIPVGPVSISATCRIVKVIDEPDRYGFVYSTLPHHPEDGEESFIVTRQKDGTVDVVVTAVWRPAILANHLCPPMTRYLQNRAINKYLGGIAAKP